MKLVKFIGQPLCIVLYIVGIILALRKKAAPLIALISLHLSEYLIIGRKVEKGIKGFVKCMAFGFTWWLPVKKGKSEG